MLSFVYLFLFMCTQALGFFSDVPGENLWRMTATLADCVDNSGSKICVIAVDTTAWLSVLDSVSITVESLDAELLGMGSFIDTFQKFISSKIDAIDVSLQDTIFSEVATIREDLASVTNVIESAISVFDSDISSASASILATIASFNELISTDILNITSCDVGTVITAADFAAGPYVISTPGTYTLCEDATSISYPAISVEASNVNLNLNGHTITYGVNNGCVILVTPTQTDITIHDGTCVADAVTGACCIQFNQTNTAYVNNITSVELILSLLTTQAVTIGGYSGVGTTGGISATNATNTLVYDTVLHVPDTGISFSAGSGSVINTKITDCTTGIVLQNVQNGFIENCVIQDAVQAYLIEGQTAGSVIVSACTASDATTGFEVLNSINVILRDCIAEHNELGILVTGTSSDTIIKQCATINGTAGIEIDAGVTNTQILNTCSVNNGVNLFDFGTNTVFINLETVLEILCGKIEDLQSVGESLLDVDIASVSAIASLGISIIDSLNNAVECLVSVPITQENVPYTITKSGVYTLCGDITHNGGPVITNFVNDVVIDLNGYAITTDNNAIVSTQVGTSNLIIKNGILTTGLEAIVIDEMEGVQIQQVLIPSASNIGIRITNSVGLYLYSCSVCGNNNTSTGFLAAGAFYFQNCGSVIVQDCQAVNSTEMELLRGFSVNGINPTGGMLFQDCTASGATLEGYRLAETSGDLSMIYMLRCKASDVNTGFSITHTNGGHKGPLLVSCIATDATQGFMADSTNAVLFDNCKAEHHTNAGYLMTSSTDTVSSVLCTSQNNGTGFILDGVRPVCDRCDAISNVGNGFVMSANAIGAILYQCLASRNGLSGINDNNVAVSAVVDTRSQDNADPNTGNPAYNLNTLPDVKGGGLGSVVVRTS